MSFFFLRKTFYLEYLKKAYVKLLEQTKEAVNYTHKEAAKTLLKSALTK